MPTAAEVERKLEQERKTAHNRHLKPMNSEEAARTALEVWQVLWKRSGSRAHFPMLKDGYKIDHKLYRALQTLLFDSRFSACFELAGAPVVFVTRNRCGVPFETYMGLRIYAFFSVVPERMKAALEGQSRA